MPLIQLSAEQRDSAFKKGSGGRERDKGRVVWEYCYHSNGQSKETMTTRTFNGDQGDLTGRAGSCLREHSLSTRQTSSADYRLPVPTSLMNLLFQVGWMEAVPFILFCFLLFWEIQGHRGRATKRHLQFLEHPVNHSCHRNLTSV